MTSETITVSVRDPLDNFSAGTLYDRVVLGKTAENKAGFAYFPPDTDIFASINSFFESARTGRKQSHNLLTGGLYPFNIDIIHLDNALTFLHSGFKFEQMDDVINGLKGIMFGDADTTDEQKVLAIKFTKNLYKS